MDHFRRNVHQQTYSRGRKAPDQSGVDVKKTQHPYGTRNFDFGCRTIGRHGRQTGRTILGPLSARNVKRASKAEELSRTNRLNEYLQPVCNQADFNQHNHESIARINHKAQLTNFFETSRASRRPISYARMIACGSCERRLTGIGAFGLIMKTVPFRSSALR